MTTNAELARKIRDAIFDKAEQDGRVMHGDAMDTVIERVLAAERPVQSNPYSYGFYVTAAPSPWPPKPSIDCQGEPVIWGME